MIHDPHCPAPEMCSECGEFPASSDHDCEEKSLGTPIVLRILILAMISFSAWLAWDIYTGLRYGGFLR